MTFKVAPQERLFLWIIVILKMQDFLLTAAWLINYTPKNHLLQTTYHFLLLQILQ